MFSIEKEGWSNDLHQFPSFEQKSESSLKKQYNESDRQS